MVSRCLTCSFSDSEVLEPAGCPGFGQGEVQRGSRFALRSEDMLKKLPRFASQTTLAQWRWWTAQGRAGAVLRQWLFDNRPDLACLVSRFVEAKAQIAEGLGSFAIPALPSLAAASAGSSLFFGVTGTESTAALRVVLRVCVFPLCFEDAGALETHAGPHGVPLRLRSAGAVLGDASSLTCV